MSLVKITDSEKKVEEPLQSDNVLQAFSLKHDPFKNQPSEGVEGFRLLSAEWRERKSVPTILIEGAGDVVRRKYWPYLKEAAISGRANVVIANVRNPPPEFLEELQSTPNTIFLIKNSPRPVDGYRTAGSNRPKEIKPDVVLIATPDDQHTWTTFSWLGGPKAIFVEKPLDSSSSEGLKRAELLEKFLPMKDWMRDQKNFETVVVPIDHFYAKISEIVDDLPKLIEKIGGRIEQAQFTHLEQQPVWQKWPYDPTADLLIHGLNVLTRLIDMKKFDINKAVAFRTSDYPKEAGDTFNYTELALQQPDGHKVIVKSIVGKAMGGAEESSLVLKGPTGEIKIQFYEFTNDHPIEVLVNGESDQKAYKVGSGHGLFLRKLINGELPDTPVGLLSLNETLDPMRIVVAVRNSIGSSTVECKPGSTKEELLKKASIYDTL